MQNSNFEKNTILKSSADRKHITEIQNYRISNNPLDVEWQKYAKASMKILSEVDL
jgi:hypothetical protein